MTYREGALAGAGRRGKGAAAPAGLNRRAVLGDGRRRTAALLLRQHRAHVHACREYMRQSGDTVVVDNGSCYASPAPAPPSCPHLHVANNGSLNVVGAHVFADSCICRWTWVACLP